MNMPVTSKDIKIGIYGGTFNPIHNGHIAIAERVRQELALDMLYFTPCHIPCHKDDKNVAPSSSRVRMITAVCEGKPYFACDDREMKRGGISYSIDTITDFKRDHHIQHKLYFVIGADTLWELHTWKNIQELAQSCIFVVVSRPEYSLTGWEASLPFMTADDFYFITDMRIFISSSAIRLSSKRGEDIHEYVPECVHDFIIKERIYV